MEIKKYLKYAYCDENDINKIIAVIDKETPQNIIDEFKKKYDEVEFE